MVICTTLLSKFYINLGTWPFKWLSKLIAHCFNQGKIVTTWNKLEITAILRLGKSNDNPENVRHMLYYISRIIFSKE